MASATVSPSADRRRLELLKEKLHGLLNEQSRVSDDTNAILSGDGKQIGLIENTRKMVKNIDAAIVTAKHPGYYSYYKPPTHIRQAEKDNLLITKSREISKLQTQIDQVRADIAAVENRIRESRPRAPRCDNLKQWFDHHGRPDPNFGGKGFKTEFLPSTKMYGGNEHFSSFKSVSATMSTGRLTK